VIILHLCQELLKYLALCLLFFRFLLLTLRQLVNSALIALQLLGQTRNLFVEHRIIIFDWLRVKCLSVSEVRTGKLLETVNVVLRHSPFTLQG